MIEPRRQSARPAERPAALPCVHSLFEEAARSQPQATAVEAGDLALSYAELDARANRLARHLQSLGIGPDDRVAICLPRSVEQVTAVLAVLKAGAAYLPLDPAYPAERLAFMVADSQVKISLGDSSLASSVPLGPRALLIDQLDLAGVDASRPPCAAATHNLAFVVYTSGSTGRPKGVAMPHQVLANLFAYQLRASAPRLRTLQFTALGFDVSCQEMFTTWGSGGTLVLTDENTRRDPQALLELVSRARIERLFLPFAALQTLAAAAKEPAAAGLALREVITAGEQLVASEAVKAWFGPAAGRQAPRLVNQYGPSETHVVTVHDLDVDPSTWPDLPPIGAEIPGTRAYVVDETMALAAPGAVGELHLGGLAPARGYLDQPEATGERFLPDPFSPQPGGRMYRTGDLARRRSDGTIEFLGRADHQVKVRGFRIELGEVETVLSGHPSVVQCVVAARDRDAGEKQLVAYLVLAPSGELDVPRLRAYVGNKLPEYMVPAAFVALDRLPLTPSGKVDRMALPAPSAARPELGHAYVPPRTPLEDKIAAVWRRVLRLDRIGVTDRFADLGGDSLQALRLVAALRDEFHFDVAFEAIAAATTITDVAAWIDRRSTRPDMVNRLQSLGLDRGWRRQAAEALGLRDGASVLDVAIGHGDMALAVLEVRSGTRVVGVDRSPAMLEVARGRITRQHAPDRIDVRVGIAERLPFEADTFDAAVIAFGLRDLTERWRAVGEMARVTRPGGKVAVLELSDPKSGALSLATRVVRRAAPSLGALLSGVTERRRRGAQPDLPSPDEVAAMMREVGLVRVSVLPLALGVCHLVVADRPRTEG